MKTCLNILVCSLLFSGLFAQNKIELEGQLSLIGSYAPENELELFAGGRYIPQLSYALDIDSSKTIDFEVAANLSGSTLFHPFDKADWNGEISPYRAWARYNAKQFELRIGLQKIDFGSASILRPLQWFNQIDPRDPLQLTNGVYGVLGRYYFLNNANIWLWGLYGNDKPRGFDAIGTNSNVPEFGGRFQHPVPRGELALSYHHRTASSENLPIFPIIDEISENRIALDGKWDVGVGLWFETAYIHKSKDLGVLTHQTLINLGMDYTFGLGNGLNVIAEHLVTAYDEEAFEFNTTNHVTATTFRYPLGFFDNLSSVLFYNWTSEDFVFFLNYEHQFNQISGYLMGFVNPKNDGNQQGIQQNELVNQFGGFGFRVMVVYNH